MVTGHEVRGPSTRLSRMQALRVSTRGSTWFDPDADRFVSIDPSKYADLAVLSADYLTAPADQIRSLTSVPIVVGGRPV